jgi:hypothetical protein
LLPGFAEKKLHPNEEALSKLHKRLENLELPVFYKMSSSPLAKEFSGKTYTFDSNGNQLQSLKLEISDTLAILYMRKASKDYVLNFSAGRWHYDITELPGPNLVPNTNIEILRPFRVAGSYAWLDSNSIELTLRYIESPHTETITCIFLNNKVGVSFKNIFTREDDIKLIEGISK